MNPIFTAKFGGTSLADAAQFRRVADIIRADARRRLVVVSAPGKRYPDDDKITDLLISCQKEQDKAQFEGIFGRVSARFIGIRDELGLGFDIEAELEKIKSDILSGEGYDYAASRGEYLNALLLANFLGAQFIDASELIFFNAEGKLNTKKTYQTIKARLTGCDLAVVPGFYGKGPNGRIKTFPRGGSDITGSVIARGAEAVLYENWTDVSGIMMADPRIIPEARIINVLTYRELRELSYMGANVLHEDAVFPVRELDIPINIRNTNAPEHLGTIITSSTAEPSPYTITGLAGRKNYTVLLVDKAMMNNEIGFARKLLGILEKHRISVEHMPTGIDTISVVFDAQALGEEQWHEILAEIHAELSPDSINVIEDIALIAVVGRDMQNRYGTSGRIMTELGHAGINISLLNQPVSEMTIIVGVHNEELQKTIRVIYDVFAKS